MTLQDTKSQTIQTASVKRQIMNRVTPVLVITFIVVAIIFSVVIYNRNRDRIERNHTVALANRVEQINLELASAVDGVVNIANNDSVSNFGVAVQNIASPTVNSNAPPDIQNQLVRDFITLASLNPSTYAGIRFITPSGAVWTEVRTISGVPVLTNNKFQPNIMSGDENFLKALDAGSTVVMSSLAQLVNNDGVTQPVLHIYAPVRQQGSGSILGVVQLDYVANALLNTSIAANEQRTLEQHQDRWVLVSRDGVYLADSSVRDVFQTSNRPDSGLADKEPGLADFLAGKTGLIPATVLGGALVSSGEITIGNAPTMPWRIILVEDLGAALSGTVLTLAGIIVAGGLGCVGVLLFLNWVLTRRLQPLTNAAQLAHQLAVGQIDDTLPPISQNDEMGQLVRAFKQISSRMETLNEDMETQAYRYIRNLSLAVAIGQETQNLTNVDDLINRALTMICEQFGYQQSQIFLLDDISLHAILKYSYGPSAQRLLSHNFKVPVGANNVVGQAAEAGKLFVVSGRARGYPPTFPEVQAELALPLHVSGRIIGVMDILSQQPDVFLEDEQLTFQLLADQIALAINNAELVREAQQRIQQSAAREREITRKVWDSTTARAELQEAYHYDLLEVSSGESEPAPNLTEAMSVPISIRGEVIATMTASLGEGQTLTQGDEVVLRSMAERVALAIEGARLFGETQSSLSLTSKLYDMSRNLNEAESLEEIVKAIIDTVMPDAASGQVWIFDEYSYGTAPDWMETIALWSAESLPDEDTLRGRRMRMSESVFLRGLHGGQIQLVYDLERDDRLEEVLKALFRQYRAQALVFIPFSVRGAWRGILTMHFDEPRRFSENDGRIFTALIDQAGVAIDNRLLLQQTESTLDQIERLYAASRSINTSETLLDMLRAAAVTTSDSTLTFELGLFEGALDNTGWPTRIRLVGRSTLGQITELNTVSDMSVSLKSRLRQREAQVIVDQYATWPFSAHFPLFSANQPIALFSILGKEPRELSSEDYEIYQALTGQMSTVLEKRRLFEQTEQTLDETRRLYAASRNIFEAQDANTIYQIVSQNLSRLSSEVNHIAVYLAGPTPTPDAPYLDVVHVWNRGGAATESTVRLGARLSSDAAPFAELVGSNEGLVVFSDLDTDLADKNRLRVALQRNNAVSMVIAAVRSKSRWFGVLVSESEHQGVFEEQYQRFTRALADQVAIALENLQLFEEARQEAQRALALAEAGQLANRIGADFEANIESVFARVAEPANYDRWLLMMINEATPNWLDKITWKMPSAGDRRQDFAFDMTTTDHSIVEAVRLNKTLTVNNPAQYPGFSNLNDDFLHEIGKHIATPFSISGRVAGALMMGRGLDTADLDERDEQLIKTLAAQVAVAFENRYLFDKAEDERQYLNSILETMPTGIIVLDSRTYRPIRHNQQAEYLLGRNIDYEAPFDVAAYNLYRTGTNVHYPVDEMPVFVAASTGHSDFSDDVAAIRDDNSQIDLLVNAAPIRDARGHITAIVTAFQDISNLRGLENAMQENLRETISLYEATRALSEATEKEDVLDALLTQLSMLELHDAFVVLLDLETNVIEVARALSGDTRDLPASLFTDEPVLIEDVHGQDGMDAIDRATLLERGILSLSSTPLRARDETLGWIVLTYDHARKFDIDDDRFLTTLSDSSAVAIDNRNLLGSTEIAYQEAATLYQTVRALANTTTPDDIVNAAVYQMRRPHISQVLMVTLITPTWDEQSGMAEVISHWLQDEQQTVNMTGIQLTPDQFPAWRLLTTNTIITVDDVQAEDNLNEFEKIGLEAVMECHALTVLPLRTGDHALGALLLISNQPHRHTESDRRIYQSFSEQASLSLEARRLFEQTERRARQLATSSQVSRVASSILDLNELMSQLVNLIQESFGYDHVQIFLMDAEDRFADLRASTGESGSQLLEIKHKLEKGSASVIGQVTAHGEPVVALDTADASVVHRPNPYLPLTRSEMALPLIVKNKVVGALDVQSNRSNAFGDEDVQVLTTLAGQISVAIDNAQLFEQSTRSAEEMKFLFDVTAEATSPDKNLNESLQTVAKMVRNGLNTMLVSFYLTVEYVDDDDTSFSVLRPFALSGSGQPLSEVAEVRLDDRDNLLSWVANEQESVLMGDVLREDRYLPIDPSARSAVIVPMISGNSLNGLIVMEDSRPHYYTQDTVTLLRTLTSSLSAIVQSAQLLEQVQRSNDRLIELDRLKSDFLANMSHELRTPLNSIIGFSRVILKGIDGPLTEMQEQDLSTIYTSGQHLLGLINDILDQAKINSGKMDLQLDYFDIKPVVEGVRSIGIGLVKDKPIDIRIDLASGLPKVYGDEFRTRQVLLNLISNASKFTNQGNIIVRVSVEKHELTLKDMVRVDVIDSGIGIAEKDIPLLFEAFRQVDSSLTRTVGGTGLGLPIAKSLIEMQGGDMQVESEVNVGSTFSIRLPLEPTPVNEIVSKKKSGPIKSVKIKKDTAPLSNETIETPSAAVNGIEDFDPKLDTGRFDKETVQRATGQMPVMQVKRQVLLIEDNPTMVDQFRRAIQNEGFDIFSASIPLEAEAMASGLRPTLIIMDVDFSNGAGWDIMKRLQARDDTRDIPLVVVTMNPDADRIMESGAFALIQRPFVPETLLEVVHRAEADSKTDRILIIDDQPDSTRLLRQVLDTTGQYRIFAAHNGLEGVSMVARHRPDLVILDLRMPEMDGFAVLDELRANPETANIPIMIVTGDTLNNSEQQVLAELEVIYKTDLSQENYQELINGVKAHLSRNGD